MADSMSAEALAQLAERLEGNPDFMAYVLAAYRRQEGLSEDELAAELSVLPALVIRLALCKRPNEASPGFAERVRRMSDFTLIDEAKLANILRQVRVLDGLSGRPVGREEIRGPLEGLLAAARDRHESEPEKPRNENDSETQED